MKHALAVVAALLTLLPGMAAAQTAVQFGAVRTASPWNICVYDSANVCQNFLTLPSTGGGPLVPSANGGTGVNNGASTITIGGNIVFSGSFPFNATLTGSTSVTFPTSGTLIANPGTTSCFYQNNGSGNFTCGSGGSGISALTGDVTASGSGSVAATLATVNSGPGSVGSSTAIPVLVTNGKGLITSQATAAVIAPAGTLTGGTLASGVTASSLTSFGNAPTIANANLTGVPTGAGASVTINSTVCPLSGSCTIGVGALIVNTTNISGGTPNGLLFNSAGTVGNLATANSGVLVTSSGGVPSISTTLPNALAMGTPASLVLTNATGLPISTGLGGAGTGVLTALGINIGSAGAVIVNAGALGTPSSGTATNLTGLPLTTGVTGLLPLANGGTNNNLTASAGGLVWSDASKLNILAGTVTAGQCLLSGSSATPTWGSCSGAAAVSSVTNSDSTLTVSPTTGAVVASLNVGHANTWTAAQTFTNSDFRLLGSSTGYTTFTSANASATNYTLTIPAVTDTAALLGLSQTFSGTDTFSGALACSGSITCGTWTISGSNIYNNNTGNVGIGSSSSPSAQLQVFGQTLVGSTTRVAPVNDLTFQNLGNNFAQFFDPYLPGNTGGIALGGSTTIAGVPSSATMFWNVNTGDVQAKAFRGYADLREWASLSCNPASPTSTNVAASVVAAATAGWTHFFMPKGCFLYLGDAAWTAVHTVNTIPTGYFFRGEDWQTSGVSVCSTYTGCTPSSGTEITAGSQVQLQNMFYMSYTCYNLDNGTFGNPPYCPLGLLNTGTLNGGFVTGYPFQPINLYMSAQSLGSWNGTDSPVIGITNNSQGDGLFIDNGSGVPGVHLLNLFGIGGTVSTLNADGHLELGNTSTAHGSGIINVQDNTSNGTYFPGNTAWTVTSDKRLKTDIHADGSELTWLSSFKVRQYKWIKSGKAAVGPIAQELQVSHPELVHTGVAGAKCDGDNIKGCMTVDTPDVWQMLKAMQDMQAEIVALQQKAHRVR